MKQSEKIKQVKQQAKRTSERLQKMGFDVSPRQALEVVAAERGFATWAAYEASLRKPEPKTPKWRKSDGPMSNEQYCKALEKEHVCPCCGSDQVEGEYVDIDGEFADQQCSCAECGSEWYDYYKIHHYVLIGNGLASNEGEEDEEDSGTESPTSSAGSVRNATSVDRYTIALYEAKTHTFIAKESVFAQNENDAKETVRAKRASNCSMDELTIYCELSVQQWVWPEYLKERIASKVPDGLLDELVIDTVLEKGLPAVNQESGRNRQEDLLDDAEARASDINNGGFEEQVEYLLQMMSASDLLNFICDEAEISPETLFH